MEKNTLVANIIYRSEQLFICWNWRILDKRRRG